MNDPGWTDYRDTCLYSTYDVTKLLARGRNDIGVMLGNGMYNVVGGRYVKFRGSFGPPKVILQLHLEHSDGTVRVLGTDAQWKTAPGPITFSCTYGGEDYDARREMPGWAKARFDDSGWPAAQLTDGPGGTLRSQAAPPIQIMEEFRAINITEPAPGIFVYDLGQNLSGWPKLSVRGPAGATVKLIPGELLGTNGLVPQRSSGGPVSFSYALRGDGIETWSPRFSYYGFRYVQLEGVVPEKFPLTLTLSQSDGQREENAGDSQKPAATDRPTTGREFSLSPSEGERAGVRGRSQTPRIVELKGQWLHSSAPIAGDFECSNPLINRIHQLILAAVRCNLQSVLTDCPHREKLGWLEVSHLLGRGVMFNYDVPTFYAKVSQDMRESQLANGLVPDIAPEYTVFSSGFRDSPEWGSAAVFNPWLVREFYGDRSLLERHYEVMARYVAYLGSDPGYFDQLRKGATTLTEAWDANPRSSQNHCMLGHAEEWFYTGLAGIRADPAAPGFKRFAIRPAVVGDVTWVKAHHDSPYGRISSRWEKAGRRFTLDAAVPPNTTATIYIPTRNNAATIRESGKPAAQVRGLRFLRSEDGAAVFEAGPGHYRFASELASP